MNECTFTSADLDLGEDNILKLELEKWDCSRPVWEEHDEDGGRCVWHADAPAKPRSELEDTIAKGDLHGATVPPEMNLTELSLPDETGFIAADLSETFLRAADLSETDLRAADLSETLLRAADLSETDLRAADLSGAYLSNADLSGADFGGADLTDAVLNNVDIDGRLERANLTRTDLFGADLKGAAFYGAVTTDTQINQATEFGAHYTDAEESHGEVNTQRARWCLRRIEQLANLNALPDQSREAFIQRRDLRRQEATGGEWLLLAGARWVMSYGESFARVLSTAGVIIVLSTLLYPVLGVNFNTGERLSYSPLAEGMSLLDYVGPLGDTLLTSLYFSVLTFTTLGFGDLQPVGLGRALATFEAGAGVTLFALLVFVLGRRSTR